MLKEIFSDRAFRVQGLKVLLLALLLVWPFRFHNANAEKKTPVPESPPAQGQKNAANKPDKKEKKQKKPKAPAAIAGNQLTREEGRKLLHQRFDVPVSIQPAVDFWKKVYTQYDRRYEIFHDTEDLSRIYSVLDFSDLYDNPAVGDSDRRAERKMRVDAEKERIRAILQGFADGSLDARSLNAEEKKIYELFKDDPDPLKFKWAAEGRIRSQTGIKDKFIAGIINSGAYMEEIEDIFTSYGLPMELTRLVFVESMFNTKVRSKVGASGIWQFMPSTGKLYDLNIDALVDERNDPITATHGAARLLKSNYEALGAWPLAINAYNSGRGTMQNAVRSLGTTRIEDIILSYRGGVYGFASRNFYPSFLAALDVANHYQDYFGKLDRKAPVRYESYSLQTPAFLGELAAAARADRSEIVDLNPHYCDEVLTDQRRIPSGYAIRVPKGFSSQFTQAEQALPVPSDASSKGSDL